MVSQGEIISVEGVSHPLVVISKDEFNLSDMVIACPIIQNATKVLLTTEIDTKMVKGYVAYSLPRSVDLRERGYFKKGKVGMFELMEVIGRLEAIIDY